MTARDAGARAGTQPPHGPSFIRRHPILGAFGVLAALSLFAAYWPVSAIVTGVVVGARATGADRVAYRLLRRGAAAVIHRFRRAPAAQTNPPANRAPEPPAPAPPTPSSPSAPSPHPAPPGPVTRAHERSQPAASRVRRRAQVRVVERAAARPREPQGAATGVEEREIGGL